MSQRVRHASILLIAMLLSLYLGGPALAEWKAGVAQQKITPAQSMWLAGYGSRTHPSVGVLNDLHAGCLVLEDDHGS
ncbi:MAG TPA: hypothetical protein VGJ16_14280, partial [Pirellulales bacterium]